MKQGDELCAKAAALLAEPLPLPMSEASYVAPSAEGGNTEVDPAAVGGSAQEPVCMSEPSNAEFPAGRGQRPSIAAHSEGSC